MSSSKQARQLWDSGEDMRRAGDWMRDILDREEHNGWANRETWAVALHINNDQGWQEQVLDLVREARDSDPDPLGDDTYGMRNRAGNVIREHFEEIVGDATDAPAEYLTRDLFMALMDIGSLWRVDWDELGAAFLDDIKEES